MVNVSNQKYLISLLIVFVLSRYNIDKLDTENNFCITLKLQLCIDDTCNTISILDKVKVPVLSCNTDFRDFQLPGNGSVASFVEELEGKISSSAISAVLLKYGIEV